MSEAREEQNRLTDLAEAIADGRPVDWDSADTPDSSLHDRRVLGGLKHIDQLLDLRRHGILVNPATTDPAVLPTDPNALAPHWGPLRIIEKVGEGAFGEVYRAHDPKLARDVALKLLRAPTSTSDDDATTAIEEGRLLARVRHPNVVTVHGADRIEGRVGVWMEFVHGRTLEQLVRERGPFSADEAAGIGIDLSRALSAVHDAGLVHRDIKAQNVIREDSGRLVLMDFGTVRDRALTTDETIEHLAGTPLYVAPEILQGASATPRSDIYSLGVLIYFLVTGTFPVSARTLRELVDAHRQHVRRNLREIRPGLPAGFADIIECATAPDPAARFASAREMEKALARAATAHAAARRYVIWGGVAAAILVGAFALTRPWVRAAASRDEAAKSNDLAVKNAAEPAPSSPPNGVPPSESPVEQIGREGSALDQAMKRADFARAREIASRLRSLVATHGFAPGAAAAWIVDAWVAWREGDMAEALRRLDQAMKDVPASQPGADPTLVAMAQLYLALGRTRDVERAAALVSNLQTRAYLVCLAAYWRDDGPALLARLPAKIDPQAFKWPQNGQAWTPLLLRAGRISEADALIADREKSAVENYNFVLRAMVLAAQGSKSDALTLATRTPAQDDATVYYFPIRQQLIGQLQVEEGHTDAALSALRLGPWKSSDSVGSFRVAPWGIANIVKAAALERTLGHDAEADRAEAGVRDLLAVADADFTPTRDLGPARAGPSAKWVLVGPITNATADPARDGWFERALARELSDAPSIKVASQDRVNDALTIIGKEPNIRLDLATAREICRQDTALQALIDGRAERTNQGFTLSAEVRGPPSGRVGKTVSERARDETDLPNAVFRLALKIRRAMGEAVDSIPAGRRRVAPIATPAIEVVALYERAMQPEAPVSDGYERVVAEEKLLRQVVARDDSYVLALLTLARDLGAEIGFPDRSYGFDKSALKAERVTLLAKARALAAVSTPLERYLTECWFHQDRRRTATEEEKHTEAELEATACGAAISIAPPDVLDAWTPFQAAERDLSSAFDRVKTLAPFVEQRPLNPELNSLAASQQMRLGDLDRASRHIAAALPGKEKSAYPEVWLLLFPAYQAWAEANPAASEGAVDVALPSFTTLPDLQHSQALERAVDMLVTLGRLNRAEQIAARIPDDPRPVRTRVSARLMAVRGNMEGLHNLVAPLLERPVQQPQNQNTLLNIAINFAVQAGFRDDVRRLLGPTPAAGLVSVKRQLDFAERRYDDVIASGESLINAGPPESIDFASVRIIAQAMRAKGQLGEATNLLERYAAARPATAISDKAATALDWMYLRADLAELYRAQGRVPQARKIEAELRKLLELADADFPLLEELNNRR